MWVYLPQTRLPSAYQEVEYIESSWTQRIDTWVSPTDTKFWIKWKFRIWASWWNVLIDLSATTSTDNKRYWFQFNWLKPQWSWIMYQQRWEDNWTINASTDYEFSYNYNWDTSFIINWITKTWIPTWSATLPNWNIFCQNCNWSYQRFFIGRLYWLQLYHNTELLRDFVPCYRKSDSVIWMYDLVNDTFYTNSWSWTFTKWANVYMSELKNAYIGEVIEYSIDFRWNTQAWIEADGWTFYNRNSATYSFDSDGIKNTKSGWHILIARNMDATWYKKMTMNLSAYLYAWWTRWGWVPMLIWPYTADFFNTSTISKLTLNKTEANGYQWLQLQINWNSSFYWTIIPAGEYICQFIIDLETWDCSGSCSNWQTMSGTINSTYLWYLKTNSTIMWVGVDSIWHIIHTFDVIFE